MLPIPSLKKVRITKTKISTKNRPKTVSPRRNLLIIKTWCSAPERSWSSSHCYHCCYLCCVTFPVKTQKGDRWSLGFVLVFPVPTGQEEKRSSPVPESPRKKSSSREATRQDCSRTISFNWFCLLCYLLSCYLAFYNRECLGETRSVSKEISPKEKEAWEHFSLHQQEDSFPFPISLMLRWQNPSLGPSRRRKRIDTKK